MTADPAQQALCALLFTLALMSIVHNHHASSQQHTSASNTATTAIVAGTWGMSVLKVGLVAALLFPDVTQTESEGTYDVGMHHSLSPEHPHLLHHHSIFLSLN